MSKPTANDLSVYRRDAEVFEVHSWITRGRCATVYKFAFSEHMSVQAFMIPRYMQGITTELVLEAVSRFLETEANDAMQPS